MTALRTALAVCGTLLCTMPPLICAGAVAPVIGVNVVNPQRLSPGERAALLDQLQAAGVRVIRTPLAPAGLADDYGPAIDFVERAYSRGISTDLIVGLQYRADARRRSAIAAMPDMWPSYPLSSADPVRFRAVLAPLLDRLEQAGIVLAALELGNEINWTAFNGDFPIPGEGRVFGREDLASDPEARRIASGYDTYLVALKVLKEIRDQSRLNRATPILSAGLADPGPAGPRAGSKTDAVSIGASLDYLRARGLDMLVDAYGIHSYPSVHSSRTRRLAALQLDTLAQCQPHGQARPCWLTEWGLPVDTPRGCAGNDALRASLAREMLDDFRRFEEEGRLDGLLYYAWSDRQYGLYRCGLITETGRVLLNAKEIE